MRWGSVGEAFFLVKKMYSYQHHIGDFLKDTANLNDHQMVTYLRLIWSYYDTEKPIQGDCERIAFAMRSDEKTVRLLLEHYFILEADGWVHKRCERLITEYKGKREKAEKSANARWNNASAMRTHTERNANAIENDANREPITDNREPFIKPKGLMRTKKSNDPSVDWVKILQEHGVSEEVATAYLAVREKKKKSMTRLALKRAITEAGKAGITLGEALEVAAAKGWLGFEAGYYENLVGRGRYGGGSPPQITAHTGFEQRDYGIGIKAL